MELLDYKTDLKKESKGSWVSIDGETAILVARLGNPEAEAAFEKMGAVMDGKFSKNMHKREREVKTIMTGIAKTCLLGWKGLTLQGAEVPYTPEKALELMTDPAYASFSNAIMKLASDEENFRTAEVEKVAKKL